MIHPQISQMNADICLLFWNLICEHLRHLWIGKIRGEMK